MFNKLHHTEYGVSRIAWGMGVVVALFMMTTLSHAAGTTAANFLKIAPGARAAGVGEAYTALADDAGSVYWNAAGLSRVTSHHVLLSHNAWFQDIGHSYVAAAWPLRSRDGLRSSGKTLGFAATYLTVGDMERRSDSGALQSGSFTAADMSVAVAYGQKLDSLLSVPLSAGLSFKFIRQSIAEYSANAVALDVGLQMPMHVGTLPVRMGVSMLNVGTPITFIHESFALPQTLKVGFSFSPLYATGIPLLLACDVSMPNDHDPHWNVGTEYVARGMVSVRAGYSGGRGASYSSLNGGSLGFSGDDESLAPFLGFMAGVGIQVPLNRLGGSFDTLNIDYALVPFGELGNTHRMSVGLAW